MDIPASGPDGANPAPVPLLDLRRGLAPLRPALLEACARVIDSGHFILGPEVVALEAAMASLCDSRFAIGTSSGTDALLLALMAHDIGPGDEVICPTFSFFATAGSIWRLGARPAFVDVCPGCYNLQAAAAKAALTERTRAIMPVHLFGQLAAMPPILALARAHGLAVIEDAAQALGAHADGSMAGAHGDVGCFSFFPSKNLGGFGDAGLLTTQDPALAQRLRILRVHGGEPKYHHAEVGGNFRLDALQAALLGVKLPTLGPSSQQRTAHAARYGAAFMASGLATERHCTCTGASAEPEATMAPIALPPRSRGVATFNQYILQFASGEGMRNHVRRRLQAAQIGCEVYYPVPLHRQACFASLEVKGRFPVAEAAARGTLALPVFPELRHDEQDRIVDEVLRAVACGPIN